MTRKNRKRASLGCFFWIAFILLIALLFFINRNNIKTVLENTNAKEFFQKKEEKKTPPEEVDLSVIQDEIEKINSKSEEAQKTNETQKKEEIKTLEKKPDKKLTTDKKESQKESKDESANQKDGKLSKESSTEDNVAKKNSVSKKEKEKKNEETSIEQKKEDVKTKPQNNELERKSLEKGKIEEVPASLFFGVVEPDGRILWKKVTRKVKKTDSPMTTALNSLLAGPVLNESKKGIRSFIPANTRLLSATVKNGIATLNLSEEFQFNQFGLEAYRAQLAQVVFTACEFPTVDSVQFLIAGQKKQYLGGEGVWIGSPLSKNSF